MQVIPDSRRWCLGLGACLGALLFLTSCSSPRMVALGDPQLNARMQANPGGLAIVGYEHTDGAHHSLKGHVRGFGDSLFFTGEVGDPSGNGGAVGRSEPEHAAFVVPRDSVAYLEVREFDAGRTGAVLLRGLIVAGVALLVYGI